VEKKNNVLLSVIRAQVWVKRKIGAVLSILFLFFQINSIFFNKKVF